MAEKTRLNLAFSKSVTERLDALVDHTEAENKTEVIRRALAVYDHLWAMKADGATLVVRHPDREDESLLLI